MSLVGVLRTTPAQAPVSSQPVREEVERHADGRFRCELEKPIRELTESEVRQVLTTLEWLARALRSRLQEEGDA